MYQNQTGGALIACVAIVADTSGDNIQSQIEVGETDPPPTINRYSRMGSATNESDAVESFAVVPDEYYYREVNYVDGSVIYWTERELLQSGSS
ncbi:hypothetical protein [Halobacterium salinarum]|uniref:hypothetical protein n=1 Tax=Halobacterium salinarum TaxID=2242 RepID=UPI002555F8B6|nr:hypothetical protein [Halobacterium salinarum]MDL0143565.1 hypothetical protein [Halobacterium salinarum]